MPDRSISDQFRTCPETICPRKSKRRNPTKHTVLVTVASVSIFLIVFAGTIAASEPDSDSAALKSVVAGTYSCGFDSFAGYQAPGTNSTVDVGGVFTLTIDSQGTIVKSDATLSVADGGAGPAVCKYGSGSGKIDTAPFTGSLGTAALTYAAANSNSALCPSGDASITFGAVIDGLKFIYTSSSGFTGHGSCGVAAPPTAKSFTCNYNVKSGKEPGDGVGVGTVIITPSLREKTIFRLSAILGIEKFSGTVCPFFGPLGFAGFAPNRGSWLVQPVLEPPDCPATPFAQVNFTTDATTIFITAPGISSASCAPAVFVANQAASIEVMPTELNFGGQKVKTTSPAQKVTITNTGTQPLNLVAFGVTGNFDLSNDCLEETLDSGKACTVEVTFTPKATGKRTGNLQIVSDAVMSKINVKLSGVGQ